VQSKFLAVGAVVPWARAGAGAVATQSYANLLYGPQGLDLMASGLSADKAMHHLVAADAGRSQRQVGMVDAQGRAAAFTGEACHAWAGHITGAGYACQGNILAPGTVEAMAACFEAVRTGSVHSGAGELADWLVAALAAGQEAGGDSRGRQSAAVLVVREAGGYGGNNDRYLDLRVDDHPEPIAELQRLLGIHHLYFGVVDPEDTLPLTDLAAELQQMLVRTGFYSGAITGVFDADTRTALRGLVGRENLEERWDGSGERIDRVVVAYLRSRFG
jgi:uncharacterized Ntn-hydrolase superfamily protein